MGTSRPGGIAGRAGRWSARHRKTAIFGWLTFVLIALVAGGALGQKTPSAAESYDGESRSAERILADAGFPEDTGGEMVLVQSTTKTVDDPAFAAAVADVERTVAEQPAVTNVVSPQDSGLVSKDGRSALVEFDIRGAAEDAVDKIAPVTAAVDAAAARHPDVSVGQYGNASAQKELDDDGAKEEQRSQMLSFGGTLIILLLTFGALLAASVPLILAITAVLGTTGLVAVASQVMPMDEVALPAIILIGLAVGVDYSLFYVRREREERARGRAKADAVDIAAATSGRAVLISGLTVITAMGGLLLTGNTIFSSMGVATMLVTAVAVIGSLTVLPAVLAGLGDRIEKGRIPVLGKRRSEAGDSRVWGWIVDRTMRRPVVATVLAAGALIALAIPALGMQTKLPGVESMPNDLQTIQTYKAVQKAFPAEADYGTVAVQAADVNAPAVKAAIADLTARAERDPQITGSIETEVNPSGTVARLSVGLPGSGADDTSLAALRHLREDLLPATVGKVPGVEAHVTGVAAATEDFNQVMKTKTPIVFAFVLGLAFLLMLVTFRSIVIPIKAIVLNLLSVGASYGLLTLIFQKGHGEKLLGFESNGAVTSWLPLFLFVILFGLSMDYHVFILSRVREAWQRGMGTEKAVAHGIKSTAGTVTSAATIMVIVFATFAMQSSLDMKQMGVGLAFAVLIDATIIRGVLLPASMRLLGDWNWYLPRWLQWLPELDHEGTSTRRRHRGGTLPEPAAA